jgi:hypothetical protein
MRVMTLIVTFIENKLPTEEFSLRIRVGLG